LTARELYLETAIAVLRQVPELDTDRGIVLRIKRHPTSSFFILTFAISWTFWFLAPLADPGMRAVFYFFGLIAGFGPAFAAIAVSWLLDSSSSHESAWKRVIVFVAVFGVTLVVRLLGSIYISFDLDFVTTLCSMFSCVIAAYVASSVYHPKRGVALTISGLKKVKSAWVWVALLLPFVWQYVGGVIDLGLGGNELYATALTAISGAALAYPVAFFFGGSLNEEPGWRGFAVPRTQQKFSPIIAGLVLGVIWSVWHLPLHVIQYSADGAIGFLFRFLYNVPFGVLFSWLYNRSGGNLLACMLLHASINASSVGFGENSQFYGIFVMIALTAFLVVKDKMYRKKAFSAQNPMRTACKSLQAG
jgi:uncharacterized protein